VELPIIDSSVSELPEPVPPIMATGNCFLKCSSLSWLYEKMHEA